MATELVKTNYTSEAGHWYTTSGEPAYTVKSPKGERPTTLRDARKLNLLPSVTTIIGMSAKPGLVNWMVDQAIMAALTLPRVEGESDKVLLARIKADSQERAKKARERGTQIHAWCQQGFEGILDNDEGRSFYLAAVAEMSDHWDMSFFDTYWYCERSFAHLRYGGKSDLVNITECVIDIKTTDKPLETVKLWDEHYMQLAAYKRGLGLPSEARGAILYVHSVEPAAKLIFAEPDELAKGWQMFNALLDYWYAAKGFNPTDPKEVSE